MQTSKRAAVAVVALSLAGCSQSGADLGLPSLALPSIPSLPSASSILPSASSIMPSIGTSSGPRAPERISGNLYRIDASDRKIDDPTQRENYTLLRAAEGAKKLGATHFLVSGGAQAGDNRDARQSAAGQSTTLIRTFHVEAGSEPPTGALAVDEIIHFFGPNFGRGGEPANPPASMAAAAPSPPMPPAAAAPAAAAPARATPAPVVRDRGPVPPVPAPPGRG